MLQHTPYYVNITITLLNVQIFLIIFPDSFTRWQTARTTTSRTSCAAASAPASTLPTHSTGRILTCVAPPEVILSLTHSLTDKLTHPLTLISEGHIIGKLQQNTHHIDQTDIGSDDGRTKNKELEPKNKNRSLVEGLQTMDIDSGMNKQNFDYKEQQTIWGRDW